MSEIITKHPISETIKLEPCPFCGAEAILLTDGRWYSIHCQGPIMSDATNGVTCGVQPHTAWHLSEDAAAAAWNQRPNIIETDEKEDIQHD